MVSITSINGRVKARFRHENGRSAGVDISMLARSDPSGHLLACLVQVANTLKPYSQIRLFRDVNITLGGALTAWGECLPRAAGAWQVLVSRLYEYHFTRTDTRMSLNSLVGVWNSLAHCLERLRDHCGYIPPNVVIPHVPARLEAIEATSYEHSLIGQAATLQSVSSVDKLLLPLDLSRTDAAYLEEVRDGLVYRSKLLEQCLVAWWEQIKAHYAYGQDLLHATNWPELRQSLLAQANDRGVKRLTNGAATETLANQLAVIVHQHDGLHSDKVRASSPFLPSYAGNLHLPADAPPALNGVPRYLRVDWMLGKLSAIDCTILAALLILRNPNFTPYAILNARIADRDGKHYLELGDQGLRFRVDKPRAKAMKESALDESSAEIVRTLFELGAAARQGLQNRQSAAANYLMLTCDADGTYATVCPSAAGEKLRARGSLLYKAFPALIEVLPPGTITLSRIRATQGVIEWFRTGSVVAMRKRLGNSTAVVLQHYLPPYLLAAWNTRLIRRFQNLWITVAAAADDFLLEVTDFHTRGELDSFVADMLRLHAKGSSPLADALHARLGDHSSPSHGGVRDMADQLAISVSKNSLLALYLYHEAAIAEGLPSTLMDCVDETTGICPRQFINLAELLRHEIPKHSDSSLRQAHAQALAELGGHPVKAKWGTLIAQRGGYGD